MQVPKGGSEVGGGIVWDVLVDPLWREDVRLNFAAGRRRKALERAAEREQIASALSRDSPCPPRKRRRVSRKAAVPMVYPPEPEEPPWWQDVISVVEVDEADNTDATSEVGDGKSSSAAEAKVSIVPYGLKSISSTDCET
jgi:hypothetical protein